MPLAAWEKFLAQLDEISVNYRGPSGASERKRLIAEAVGTLEGGAGLGAFIEGLYERRETKIVDRLLEENKKAIFTGKGAAGAREWVMGVKDGKIKERLSFEAGYYYTGPGLKEYLGTLFPPAAQERFLTGYASRLAESEPSRAVEEYKALRPEKVSYYGLLDVMDRVDPDADTTFPDDYDEANNMGAALRQRLLKRWASFHPEAAAKYVADTPKRVKPESVRVVIAKWAKSKPEDAAGWLDRATAGRGRPREPRFPGAGGGPVESGFGSVRSGWPHRGSCCRGTHGRASSLSTTYERAQTTVCRQFYRNINWFLPDRPFQPTAPVPAFGMIWPVASSSGLRRKRKSF